MISKVVKVSLGILLACITVGAVAQTSPPAAPDAPAAAPALGPPLTGTRVGAINMERAIAACNEGQREFGSLQKKFEPKQNEIKAASDEIQSLRTQLNAQDSKLDDAARAALARQIETKQKNLDRLTQDAREEFQAQGAEIQQRILKKMAPVIQKYLSENGIGLLFDTSQPWPQGQVVIAGPAVDITGPVVEAYNAQSGVPAAPSSSRSNGTGRSGAAKTKTPTTNSAAQKPSSTQPPK